MKPGSWSAFSCSLLSSRPLLKLFVLVLFATSVTPICKAQDKIELFAGYSYFRASIEVAKTGPLGPGTPCPPNCGTPPQVAQQANLNGWEFSAQYKFLPFLGGVADFNGAYGKLHGASVRQHTLLMGPQVSLPARVSPFAHVLVGIAKESQNQFLSGGFNSLGEDVSWASAVGGGIDIKVAPFAKLRLIQIDYLASHLHGATQNQPRASAGIVFHF